MIKRNIFITLLFNISFIFCEQSIVILYGTSSSGKTSIGKEFARVAPGRWKFVGIDTFSNKHGSANAMMWQQVDKHVKEGFNVVVDTVFKDFLYNKQQELNVFIVLAYCSPQILAEHVNKRNHNGVSHDHRDLKKVLHQFYNKYRASDRKKESIDTLSVCDLENASFNHRALKSFKKDFFYNKNRLIVYIVSNLNHYDFLINTGKDGISSCAQKIKAAFLQNFSEKNS